VQLVSTLSMPSENIQRLSLHTLDSSKKYLLDSNIWITYLSNPQLPKPKEKVYMSFFEDLINSQVSIFTNSLIISEIINAMLRIAFKAYKENLQLDPSNTLTSQQIQKLEFKSDYRATTDYEVNLKNLKSDLLAYLPFVESLDGKYMPDLDDLVAKFPDNSDFNDFFYYKMALDQGLTIVTDDGDFYYKRVEILTENGKLV